MNLAIEHPLVLLGICAVLIVNAYICWRLSRSTA